MRDHARAFFAGLQTLRFELPEAPAARRAASRVGPSQMAQARPTRAPRSSSALEALEADIALTRRRRRTDVLALGPARRRELRDDAASSCCAPTIPAYVYFLEVARARRVPARVADRRLGDRPRAAARSDDGDRADVGDAHRRRLVRVRARPAGHPARRDEVRLPSEFDYATQAMLYLPRRMPDPRSPRVRRRGRARGRSRSLQPDAAAARSCCSPATPTSARCMRVAEAELDYPILVQGTAPRSALLRDFKATPNAVLLATSSFWQGVDVVGDALSCVIIDKLPFASPGDPITAARIEAISARGGSAVRRLPGAARHPGPAAGSRTAAPPSAGSRRPRVLDPRCASMGYGRRFLASLPPAPVTSRLEDIERFFATGPPNSDSLGGSRADSTWEDKLSSHAQWQAHVLHAWCDKNLQAPSADGEPAPCTPAVPSLPGRRRAILGTHHQCEGGRLTLRLHSGLRRFFLSTDGGLDMVGTHIVSRTLAICAMVVAFAAIAVPASAQTGHDQGQGHRRREQAGRGREGHLQQIDTNSKFELKTKKNGEYMQIGLRRGTTRLPSRRMA